MAAASVARTVKQERNEQRKQAAGELSAFMKYALPYVRPLKKLEKAERKAKKKGEDAVQAAANNTGNHLQGMVLSCPDELRLELPQAEESIDKPVNQLIAEETGKKLNALETALHGQKQQAHSNAKRPFVAIGIATLLFYAASSVLFGVSLAGLFGTIGIGIVFFAGFGLGIASAIVDASFSKREKALGAWKQAVHQHGLPLKEEETEAAPGFSAN